MKCNDQETQALKGIINTLQEIESTKFCLKREMDI